MSLLTVLTNRKLVAVEVDKHHEINLTKAEVRVTGVEIGTRDERQQRRIENLLVILTVAAVTFFISNLGFFRGLLLMAFCLAMFCATYADSFLRFTGGTDKPIALGERLDIAFEKIAGWIRLIGDDLHAPQIRE
jgi:hypothetical protein